MKIANVLNKKSYLIINFETALLIIANFKPTLL